MALVRVACAALLPVDAGRAVQGVGVRHQGGEELDIQVKEQRITQDSCL